MRPSFTGIGRDPLNILIVDDDVNHGRSVRDLLAIYDLPADVVSSGRQGLQQLREAHQRDQPYQALVLDLHIPDLPGIEILRAISEQDMAVKTIVLSGERELSSVAPILKLGAYDYLRKPFQAEQLVASVNNALDSYQLEREVASMHVQAEESARLYEFLLNASPDLVYMLNASGQFQFINHQLDSIFDVDFKTLTGRSWRALFNGHEALAERLEDHFVEHRTGVRATVAEEFEYVTDIGSKHSLELSAIGLYEGREADRTGEFIGTYGIIRDVTESKRTRRQLQQSQRKFYSLFMDSPDAVFIARIDDGQIIERNPNFVAMWDAIAQGAGDNDAFLWTDEYPRAQFIEGLLANPRHHEWTFEKEVQGERRFFEIRARHLELEGDACLLATLRDRTHERKAEQDRLALQQQLQQAGRMEAIGQVAGGIAHDFNNILASIIGYAELIMNARDRLQEEQVDQYLQEVVTAGHRARDLISQMLTFTRAQRGESKSVDLTSTISDVSRMLRAAIPTTIQVHTRFADTLPAVVIDPVQLQQVIINLLINARDAITGNGTIDIDVSTEQSEGYCRTCGEALHGPQVAISVKDSGHGIPADLIEKVFEMYFTTRAPDKGTGFGLWMINNFVHESQGHIQVNSTEGVGTEFRILLPAAAEETVPVTPGLVPAPKVEGRIVVVDDEVSVANFIGEVLRDRGYPTVVFTESPQALDYLQNNLQNVILLLTDGSMPLISGLELVEYVRSTDPELPVIYITGYTQTTDTQALQNLGVNMYLQKPFSIDEMMRAVATLTNLEDASGSADAAQANATDVAKPSTSVH